MVDTKNACRMMEDFGQCVHDLCRSGVKSRHGLQGNSPNKILSLSMTVASSNSWSLYIVALKYNCDLSARNALCILSITHLLVERSRSTH
jgi:hypothetical protein